MVNLQETNKLQKRHVKNNVLLSDVILWMN